MFKISLNDNVLYFIVYRGLGKHVKSLLQHGKNVEHGKKILQHHSGVSFVQRQR